MAENGVVPAIRVMALHALTYCRRLFYLEEVEEIRLADERVYAGRTLHAELAKEEGIQESRTLELESETLGLKGKLDAVRYREGEWIPYEHKRGRCRREADGTPCAWDSDLVQVSAYGMLLEHATGSTVSEGRIRYHQENVTVRVPLDEQNRKAVDDAIVLARSLRASTKRPPLPTNDRLCLKCSLAPVCLPEEERLALDPTWEPVRLYPPSPEGQVLHIAMPGAKVGRSGETIVVQEPEMTKVVIPVNEVDSVVIHGNVQVSTQALHFCATQGVPVHWFTGGGNYVGALASGYGGVQRRIRQFEGLRDTSLCLTLSRRVAEAKVGMQLGYLLRATRGSDPRSEETKLALSNIRKSLASIHSATSIDSVRGHEGDAARVYFSLLPDLVSHEVPQEIRPTRRTRRPPKDPFNALLSFGYALLYRSVLQAVLAVGLEPAFGFYHQPRSAAPPLVLDLMEIFRVPVWDVPLIGSINRRQWSLEDDFVSTREKVWLSEQGRRKAIELYERRIAEMWRHPVVQYSLSYARTLELEVRLLEKEWSGQPGLFARVRLR